MVTPFIKLFKSPKSKYFYDVGRNEIVMITDELYDVLSQIESGSASWQDITINPSEELMMLLDAGYLSCKHPSRIRHPYIDTFQFFLDRKLGMITLQITQDCNFRCKYCVYSEHNYKKQRSHSKKTMSWETAKKAIDFYFSHSLDSASRNIGFYGGEPLLQFELVKRIIEYAEQKAQGKLLSFNMTTNGSLLTDGVVGFLAAHNVRLLISIDGHQETHDRNRVLKNGAGTYNLIMNRIAYIKEQYPDYFQKIHINTVIDTTNDFDSMIEFGSELKGLPSENIQFNYIDNSDGAVFYSEENLMKAEYHAFLAYLSLCRKYPEDKLSALGTQRVQEFKTEYQNIKSSHDLPDEFGHGGPCIAGKSRLLITTDGFFYPCERVNESPHMCIGNLKTGFDNESIRRLLSIGELTSEQCISCWAIRHCSICAKLCDNGNALSADEKLRHCEGSRQNAEQKLRSIILQSEMAYRYGTEALN